MFEQNEVSFADNSSDFDEELTLEFDASQDPEAVWEWNGDSWVAMGA